MWTHKYMCMYMYRRELDRSGLDDLRLHQAQGVSTDPSTKTVGDGHSTLQPPTPPSTHPPYQEPRPTPTRMVEVEDVRDFAFGLNKDTLANLQFRHKVTPFTPLYLSTRTPRGSS